jgi:hypothetical protein
VNGRWVELGLDWHETRVVHCEVCGRLIPRRAWLFPDHDHELRACAPTCEQLYERYVVPTYGRTRPDAHH